VLDLLVPLSAGVLIGAGVAAAAARWTVRRQIRKVRAAERRARAAERLAELGSMTGGLAHEIKNPLSTIGLNAQLLGETVEEVVADEEQKARLRRRIGTLRREVDRLRGILTDFLEYAGELRLDPQQADLNETVSELADFFMPQAEKQGVRLRTDLVSGHLAGRFDVPHLKQAVLNLMLNAVQAMAGASANGSGKELILRTSMALDADRQPVLQLHVIDTGPGMSRETLDRIFQPYFTTKSGGTGLGLPTARRIVEAHGGRLEVYTEPGKGSDFVIVVPLHGPPVPQV
jgi:signal transduction histidine kinase